MMTMTWHDDHDHVLMMKWYSTEKNCLVDTYTNKLYLSLFGSRWTHIHCLIFRSKTNNLKLIKLTESATYSVHSDKNKGKMTHWTRYCATASFVYHSGKPILTLNLSPSRQSNILVGITVKSLYKYTCNTDSSQNEHFASVPNTFFTSLHSLMVAMVFVLSRVDCKAVFMVINESISIIYQFWQNTLTCKSLDKILWCYHSNEISSAVISHGTIYLVCSSNFWVCGWNPMVLPFKWNLFSSTFT